MAQSISWKQEGYVSLDMGSLILKLNMANNDCISILISFSLIMYCGRQQVTEAQTDMETIWITFNLIQISAYM